MNPLDNKEEGLESIGQAAIQAYMNELKRELVEIEDRSKRISNEMVVLSRRQLHLQQLLQQNEPRMDSLKKHLTAVSQEIAKQSEIEQMQWHEDCLEVRVRTVYLNDESTGDRYRIGPMRMLIFLNGEIKVLNQDNTGEKPYWDHPHIQNGIPCLGNLKPGLLKLIGQLEFSLVVRLLLDFLHIYDPDTAYGPITLWERVNG